MDIKLKLLGSFELSIDGESVRVTSPKAQALIAWLALHAQPQDRDQLASLNRR